LAIKQTTLLPRAAVAKGGPVPKLLALRGVALPLWLLLIAAAGKDTASVDVGFYVNFASRCLGLEAPDGTLRSTMTRALDHLVRLKLIAIKAQRHGHTVIQLRALNGTGDPYTMPHRSEKVIYVPGALFHNGWHHTLAPKELAALLIALCEEAYQYKKHGPHMWQKSRSKIAGDYGLAASTWSEAKKGLQHWGLLRYQQVPVAHQPGALYVDRYTVDTSVLDRRPEEVDGVISVLDRSLMRAPNTGQPMRVNQYIHITRSRPSVEKGTIVPMPRQRRNA
jgi:hypothetical protein